MKPIKSFFAVAILFIVNMNVVANTPYEEIGWEQLIPEGAIQPMEYSLDDLHRLDELMAEEAENADIIGRQVASEMAGKKVKIPAYVVPLDSEGERFKEFLLVPYFGACIHVPPPPPNQIIFGVHKKGIQNDMFDAVWVFGTLQIETINSELAETGYSMAVDKIELVDWKELEENYPKLE